jgi:hypothetical protein
LRSSHPASREVRGQLTFVPLIDHLDAVEAQSICIFRKLLRISKKLALLWSLR